MQAEGYQECMDMDQGVYPPVSDDYRNENKNECDDK
jgi:hypothetical protein